jgi:hypothetical protein
MSFSLILVGIVCLLLLYLLLAAARRSRKVLENPAQHLRPVDVEAFRNLIDPAEEEFLRNRLQPADFRMVQRERLAAAVEYIRGAARNASILLKVAEAARSSPDPAITQGAQSLIDEATRLRLYAFQTIPRLYVAMLFPGRHISPLRVAESYEQMTRQVASLGAQYPTRGVSAVL